MSWHKDRLEIARETLDDGSRLLRLGGELDIFSAEPLRHSLRELDERPIHVDLSGLRFIDSTGLSILLSGRQHAQRSGTALRLHGATCQVHDVLERTGLLELFDGSRDRQDVVGRVSSEPTRSSRRASGR